MGLGRVTQWKMEANQPSWQLNRTNAAEAGGESGIKIRSALSSLAINRLN